MEDCGWPGTGHIFSSGPIMITSKIESYPSLGHVPTTCRQISLLKVEGRTSVLFLKRKKKKQSFIENLLYINYAFHITLIFTKNLWKVNCSLILWKWRNKDADYMTWPVCFQSLCSLHYAVSRDLGCRKCDYKQWIIRTITVEHIKWMTWFSGDGYLECQLFIL